MAAKFTVDLEWPEHALRLPEFWNASDAKAREITWRLLRFFDRHQLRATFYVLGYIAKMHPDLIQAIHTAGHRIGSHGYWHRHMEMEGDASDVLTRQYLPLCVDYRSPYWDTTPWPGPSGGVYFRLLPYWLLVKNIRRSGIFWIHPHDLYRSSWWPIRRSVFLCNPWERLECLMRDIQWTN